MASRTGRGPGGARLSTRVAAQSSMASSPRWMMRRHSGIELEVALTHAGKQIFQAVGQGFGRAQLGDASGPFEAVGPAERLVHVRTLNGRSLLDLRQDGADALQMFLMLDLKGGQQLGRQVV